MDSSNIAKILAAVFGVGVVVTSGMTVQQRGVNNDLREQVSVLQQKIDTLDALSKKKGARIVVEAPDPAVIAAAAAADETADTTTETVDEPGSNIVVAETNEQPDEPSREERRRLSWNDRIEELKQNDPERYAEIKERMEGMREGFEKVLADQSAFFLSLDTELMTDEQLTSHNELLGIMEELWTATEAAKQQEEPLAMPPISQELGQKMWRMGDLLENEREVALQQMGRSMGYNDQEAQLYSEQVQDVYNKTSMRSYFRMFGRGGHGRGGWSGRSTRDNSQNDSAKQGSQPDAAQPQP
jgi:hypothetical protein